MSATLATAPPAAPFAPAAPPPLPDPGPGFELVNGELKELNVSQLSSYTAGEIYGQLRDHVRPQRLGWVFPEGNSYRCFPDDPTRVRRAETAFFSLARRTPDQVSAEGHCLVIPDLVVEVVSPNDLADDVATKRAEWLAAGAQLVWVILPAVQEVYAYHADGTLRLFRRTDTLTADPVLPDFRVPVADLFQLPAAPPA